jgi:transcriptional regulator with XRE-family HTH domain
MDKRQELGEFLKSRRARLRPDDLDLPCFGRRRVPGLRREELAQLAGVSLDYYVRLEQGRAGQPSEGVLDALGRALRLDDTERAHLHDLSRPARRRRREPPPERVRPEVRRLIGALDSIPAMVIGRRADVLAWNRIAAALLVDWGTLPPGQRNAARHVFLDEGARALPGLGGGRPGHRRLPAPRRRASPRRPDAGRADRRASMKSEEFRRWWPRHDVLEKTHGTKRLMHPIVGPLTLAYEGLALTGDGDQTLIVYTAEPGSDSETALRLLGAAAQPAARKARLPNGSPTSSS